MRFADPEWFALLAVLPLLAWGQRRRQRQPGAALRLPSLDPVPAARTARVRAAQAAPWLPWLAVALLITAMARPQVRAANASAPAQGIDVVLALDASGSMVQNRLEAETRLDAARRVAREFLRRRGEDRVAIVLFQSETLLLSPLTLDHEALDTILRDSPLNGLLPDGTATGLALAESVNLLRDSRATERVVVLLTDGEDNIRTVRPVEAAAVAEALGVRVYTIGLVAEDAMQGPVDELVLRFIAERTDGRYFRASDAAALEDAYAEIDRLERSRLEWTGPAARRDVGAWLLIPALGLVALEAAGRATVLRRAPG